MKTSWRRLEDVSRLCLQKTSSRHLDQDEYILLQKISSRCFQVFEKYCKDGYLQRDLPRSHFWEIFDQSRKFARVIKIPQVLVYYFTAPLRTTPFSGVLTEAYLESGRTSAMEFFAEILNSFKVLTIFEKLLDWVGNRLLAKALKYWAHSCSQSTN